MKRITNWIKHEYRIADGTDKPTYRDYFIIKFLFWFISIPLTACLWALFSIVLSLIFPSLNDTVNTFIIASILAILRMLFVCPLLELVYKNAQYDL